jgi:hypothetical protein
MISILILILDANLHNSLLQQVIQITYASNAVELGI